MTRELIIECMTCKEECDEEDSCFECAEKQLSEYENQIKIDAYNQALEELAEFFHRDYVFDSICRDDCTQANLVDMVDGFVEELKR